MWWSYRITDIEAIPKTGSIVCHVTKASFDFLRVFFNPTSHRGLVHTTCGVSLVELLIWLGSFVNCFWLSVWISRINPLIIIPLFNLFFYIYLDLSLLLLNYFLEVAAAFRLVHEIDVFVIRSRVESVWEGVALSWSVKEAGGRGTSIYWWLKAFAVSWAGFNIVFLRHASIWTFAKSRQL
jgi:hypothetical protein